MSFIYVHLDRLQYTSSCYESFTLSSYLQFDEYIASFSAALQSFRSSNFIMALVFKLTVYHKYSHNTSQYHQPSLHLLLPVMAFLALSQVSPILSPACTHETHITQSNHTLTATLSSPVPSGPQ